MHAQEMVATDNHIAGDLVSAFFTSKALNADEQMGGELVVCGLQGKKLTCSCALSTHLP